MSALAFCNKILLNGCKMHHVFIGKNFRFGQNRVGNLKYLANFGKNNGFKVTGSELYKVNRSKKIFSSSSIREFIKKGKIKEANKFLGHAWSVSGRVITGDKRGRLIGFPTANVDMKFFLVPPLGVYITRLKVIECKNSKTQNDWLPSISNIGTKPTVSGENLNLETHIIDLNNNSSDINIYGKRIKVELIKFLRPEKKFNSLSDLKKQIEFDTKEASKFHKKGNL